MRTGILLLVSLLLLVEVSGAVRFVDAELDLGTVAPGSGHDLSFLVTNDGDTAVALRRVWSGCGCAVARVSVPAVMPRDQLEVRVRFTAPFSPGRLLRKIYVETEDGTLHTATFTAMVASGGARASGAVMGDGGHVAGRVLVRYHPGRCPLRNDFSAGERGELAARYSCADFSVVQAELNMALLTLKPDESVASAVERLSKEVDVIYAQPDRYLKPRAAAPDDPLFSSQWNLSNAGTDGGIAGVDVGILEAWDYNVGADVVIAVLDDGVEYTHPDLVGQMWNGADCVDEHGVALGNCVHGWDFSGLGDSDPIPAAGNTHGTAMAGIAAAAADNGIAVAGAAPGARIMALRSQAFVESELVQAVYFAKHNGAKVISASWGWDEADCADLITNHRALYDAWADFPGLVVVAAGNRSEEHDGITWFDTADFGHFMRGASGADVMPIRMKRASDMITGKTLVDFGGSGHILEFDDSANQSTPFSIVLSVGGALAAEWVADERQLRIEIKQGETTADDLKNQVNAMQVGISCAVVDGVSSDPLRLALEFSVSGGGSYRRGNLFYEDPLEPGTVLFAVEALTQGAVGNGLTLVIRDSGGIQGNQALVVSNVGGRLEVDCDFDAMSSDTLADVVNAAFGSDDMYRAWPALCYRPLSNVVSVTGHNQTGGFVYDFGQNVDIAAPALSIHTIANGGTTTQHGTSAATPQVAAAAAIAYSLKPAFDAAQVKEAILAHSRCAARGARVLATTGNGYCGMDDAAQLDIGLMAMRLSSEPFAVNDAYAVDEDLTLQVAAPGVLGNDGIPQGSVLAVQVISDVLHGTLELSADGAFTYTPESAFWGTDSFAYRLMDEAGGQVGEGVVSLTIHSVNDVAIAVDDVYQATEDGDLIVGGTGVLKNDLNVEADTSVEVLVQPLFGTVLLDLGGSLSYTPDANYFGEDQFQYRAIDGTSGAVSTGVVTITVVGEPDPPVAFSDSFGFIPNQERAVAAPGVLGNDIDVDGDLLEAVLVAQPAKGSISLDASGGFQYMPDVDYDGADQFSYQARDPSGNLSGTVVVLLVGPSVNQLPTAQDDLVLFEGDQVTYSSILGNDSDAENQVLAVQLVQAPLYGDLVLSADGSFSYAVTDAQWDGVDSFQYQAVDESGGGSNTATVSLSSRLLVSVAAIAPAVGESADRAWFRVSVTRTSSVALDIRYRTLAGSAVSGVAFVPTSGTLILQPGSESALLSVELIDDTVQESESAFEMEIFDVQHAYLGIGKASVAIIDDDIEMNLSRGWHELGVPFHISDQADIWGPLADAPWRWSTNRNYVRAASARPLGGYLVFIESDRQVAYSGTAETADSISLSVGWNLIAPWRDFSFDAFRTISGNSIWIRDGRRFRRAQTFIRGRAYWIHVEDAIILPVN